MDRWVYSGLHLHLKVFLKVFGGTYYASRVPWTIPGWFLHSIFRDDHALYALHIGVFYVAALSTYFAVRNIFSNRVAAFATTLVMGTQSYFLYAIGWDYVDGASIVCVLASFAALSGAALQRRWRIAAFLWGAMICATVSIYILLVLFVPIEIGMFLLLNYFSNRRSVVATAVWAVSGGLVTMVVLGLFNRLLGGRLFYVVGQIDKLSAVAANRFRYDLPVAQWIWTSPWILVPAIAFLYSAGFLVVYGRSVLQTPRDADSELDWKTALSVCCLADIIASIIFIALEAEHFYVLQIDYRANSLLPFAFLVMGGAFAATCESAKRISKVGLLIVLTAIAVGPWCIASLGHILPREYLFQTNPLLVLSWVGGGTVLMLLLTHYHLRWAIGTGVLMAFFSLVSIGAPTDSFAFPRNPVYKQQILAIFDTSRAVARYDADGSARFWFNLSDPQGGLLGDVASTYLYAYRLVNDDFPSLMTEDGRQSSFAPGDRIILLTSGADPIPLANAAVAGQEISFSEVAKIPIRRPGVAFTAVVADVIANPSGSERSGPPLKAFGMPRVAAQEGSAGSELAFPLEITTPAQPWAYGAVFPVLVPGLRGPLTVRVRVSIDGGPVGIGILNQDGTDFLSRTSVTAARNILISLSVPASKQIGGLVIQSWDTGKRGNVQVEAIDVYRNLLSKNP